MICLAVGTFQVMQPINDQHDPTIWGLSARELHDAWWRGKGVQVVYRSEPFSPLVDAEIFLILPEHTLVIFELGEVIDDLIWNMDGATGLRITELEIRRFREAVQWDESGKISGVFRRYRSQELGQVSALLTREESQARIWAAGGKEQGEPSSSSNTLPAEGDEIELAGHFYDARRSDEQTRLVQWLVASWTDPPRVLENVSEVEPGVMALSSTKMPDGLTVIAPAWIGIETEKMVGRVLAGPDFRFDSSLATAATERAKIRDIRDIKIPGNRNRERFLARRSYYGLIKRSSDFVIAIVAIIIFAPVFLLLAILVMIDDGFPVFFGHTRQARGGRAFKCWKFRTMRRDSESMVARLQELNQADGPQVFIKDDPRVTRIGKYLRRFQLDELPQFWNVVRGEMSFVGPRPSPEGENQYCPAWREIRLSVRPGITGLWQVSRTRAPGEDFQEWIKYDIEYVRTASLMTDWKIIFRTILLQLSRN